MGFSKNEWMPWANSFLDEDLNPRGSIWSQEFPYPAYSQITPYSCIGGSACAAVGTSEAGYVNSWSRTDAENEASN